MLKIINDMDPFFENCYARISVRQYARLRKISPPTASALLKMYEKEGLLIKEKDRTYIMFCANMESSDFIMLSRLYWQQRLHGLISSIEEGTPDTIVLFGALSKAETKSESDIDLAVFGGEKMDLERFEKYLKRSIQAFWFGSLRNVKDRELAKNIINGHILSGRMKL